MNVKLEVDCTPEEARSFLGLPDVRPINAHLVSELQKRIDANMGMLKPEELMKSWVAFGGQATEQFRQLMTAAASAGMASKPKG
ncbi:MAG: hypothetical protein JOZ27_09390 [Caulobacteraceae bacterium]|nr:hypothetical protein [Caulobacteraceae bacterium]